MVDGERPFVRCVPRHQRACEHAGGVVKAQFSQVVSIRHNSARRDIRQRPLSGFEDRVEFAQQRGLALGADDASSPARRP